MINMTEYAKRREQLMQKMGSTDIAILPAASEILRNGDAVYPFRQNSDFYYLTGFDEPEAVVVLAPKRTDGEYILFNRVRDHDHEIWDGPRAGQEGARKDFLADQAFPIHELEKMLPALLAGRETIHYPMGLYASFDKLLMKVVNGMRAKIRTGLQAPVVFKDVASSLHEMRLFKSADEIACMKKAIAITNDAHVNAMKACRPGKYEYELEAELTYTFQRQGARFPAYNPIVGAGKNTCILHYILNNQQIKEGDLVLIDAGAEYRYYAADITRTFPANGRFTEEQRAIYQIVLDAQLAGIKAIKPGVAFTATQDAILKVLTKGLVEVGILKGNVDELIQQQAYLPFYMHRSGHWLGLDVHDAGQYRVGEAWRTYQPGMVLTVEPGLYLSSDIPGLEKRWHHIGVRIEDNILVTKEGAEVLSQAIPKKIEEIEAIMAD